MTIGSIQLAAYGTENRRLNGNPQITFFKDNVKRHSHFARKTISLFPETSSPNRLSPTNTSRIRVKIPRHADLLHKMFLVIRIPDIYSHAVEGFRWTRAPALAMIDKVEFRVGGEVLQTLTREWLWLQSRCTLPLDKQDQWDGLVGNTADIYDPKDPIQDEYPSSRSIEDLFLPRSQVNSVASLKQQIRRANYSSQPVMPSIQGRDLRVPLSFFFHQNVGKSFPLIAVQYEDVELEFHMRPYNELFTVRKVAYHIDTLRETTSSNTISREVRTALERDPPTPYVSPRSQTGSLTLSNGEPSSSNIIRYLKHNDTYGDNSWDLKLRVEADFIYLSEAERRHFALHSHEYLIDDLFQERRPILTGDVNVEYRIFHPVRQMFWWLQRNDVDRTNEWFNWTQFDSAEPFLQGIRDSLKGKDGVTHREYPIRAFQNTIEESYLGRDRINPGDIWLQDEHLQRGIIPNFFLKGIFRSPSIADPTAQQCLHLLYRYGFKTRFGDWFLKRLQHITDITHLAKVKKEAYEFIDVWKYRHPNDIPVIDQSNYVSYLEHAMEKATVRIHNHRDGQEEEKSAEYWNAVSAWNFHPDGFPVPGLYCNSFALEPFTDAPTGSLNASMVESITLKMHIRDPPNETRVTDTSYDVNPVINRRKIMEIEVMENVTGNLTGNTTEYPLNPLTALPDRSNEITGTFTVDSNTSVLLQDRTNDIIQFLQGNLIATINDYTPQSNLSANITYGHYTYPVQVQEPTEANNTNITSLTWNGLMDDVVISNYEYFKENRLDYPQLIETGNVLETKDPVEIYNDAAVRRADSMDATEQKSSAAQQWSYDINVIFHRWNVIRIQNGMAHKVFAN